MNYLSHFLSAGQPLAYLVILLGMIFEGDVILFSAAFLSMEGILNPTWALASVAAGLFTGEMFWYWAGRKLHANFWLYRKAMKYAEPIDRHLTDRTFYTLFISKFVYGFGHVTVMRAANLRIRFRKFLRYDLVATAAWFLVVGGLGFLSAASYAFIKKYLPFAEVVLLSGLVLLFLLQAGIAYEVKKRR